MAAKGLYGKATLPAEHPGKVKLLTGVRDLFETPLSASLTIDTGTEALQVSVGKLFDFIYRK